MKNIRNFCIIAHIDHGKSTLADRMLEVTGTIEKRKMMDQVLDSMELERERGITIKMQPVRMVWKEGILNLIDTPGHIDFSYEVSRALSAVEGAILLVDSTQGVQAQTLTVLEMAKNLGLQIIPVVTKIDSPIARVSEVKEEVAKVLNCNTEEILEVSGKTGQGVSNLLDKIVEKVPAPNSPNLPNSLYNKEGTELQALVFDFKYSTHRGITVFVRVMGGSVRARESLNFKAAKQKFTSLEVGIFSPTEKLTETLESGEIGYIVTGIKEAGIVSVGDTITLEASKAEALSGFERPNPVVWASIFPEDQGELRTLRQALARLKLTDSSLYFEEESSGVLGKGFRCGFLGMLHLEIITERLKREFTLNLIITQPSITYEVVYKNDKREKVFSPAFFPEDGEIKEIFEPWVEATIITPSDLMGVLLPVLYDHEAEISSTETLGERARIKCFLPLRELMRGLFDKLKSVSKGYASLSYNFTDIREAQVTKVAILIADEENVSFSQVISKRIAEKEGEKIVKKLAENLPRQMFEFKIQAKVSGRIVSSETVRAFRKDVTQHMYGGDITRKMKLREKQKKGKSKMKERGRMSIPHDVFIKIMRPE